VLAIALASCSSSPTSGDNAASVGKSRITNAQLQRDVELYTFLTALSGSPCGTPIEGESQESACARLALANDIREELVKAYATSNDLALGDGDVAKAIGQVETGLGGPEALDAQLKDAGLTRADFESLAARLLLFGVVQDDVVAGRVDEQALRDAYGSNLGTFTTVEVAHILVPEQADAQAIAAEVTPESFAKIAKKESQDPGSAANGGSLGSFSLTDFQTQFDPDFVAGALALEPGEISEPVQTQFGWHVIYLISRDVAAFEDVRDQLQAQQAGPAFDDWFAEQARATDIEVNPRYGSFDQATFVVSPIRSTAQEPAGATAPVPTGP
jgi:PPIC-type PPIASE domain/SurA N-terminal domain